MLSGRTNWSSERCNGTERNRKRILAQRTDGLGYGVGVTILVEAFGEGMLLRRRSGRSDGVGGLALGLALEEGEERHFGLGEEEKVMGRIGWLKKRRSGRKGTRI